MLDMGFREDIEAVLAKSPEGRQTVFFSATVPRPIQQMIERFARNPQTIRIEAQQMDAPTIEQVYYEVGHRSKLEVLSRLIDLHDFKFGIVFCGTKMGVDELTEQLSVRGYVADKIHGDMTQAMRERVMRRFREHKVEFLVATDVAARGIDVDDVEVVFNYDLPQDPEDYVHRIGRTGRAGRSGRAITFVAGRELYKVQQILRFTKGRIRRENVPSRDLVEEKRTAAFFETLRETLEAGDFKKQDGMVDRLLDQGYPSTDIISALVHLLANESAHPVERIPEDNPKPVRAAGGKYPAYVAGAGPARGEGAPTSDTRRERPAPRAPMAESDRPSRLREGDPGEAPSPVSHEPGMVRLALSVGREHSIAPGDIVGVVAGVTRLPREVIGAIKLLPRQTLVDVSEEHASFVLQKLKGIQFKGQKLHASLATEAMERTPRGKPAPRSGPRKEAPPWARRRE